MANNITRPFVEKQLENLNILTGMPTSPYHTNEEGNIVPGNGNYHLDGAYGGYAFCRMTLQPGGTGTEQVGNMGYVSLKVISNYIRMFSEGYRAAKETTTPVPEGCAVYPVKSTPEMNNVQT